MARKRDDTPESEGTKKEDNEMDVDGDDEDTQSERSSYGSPELEDEETSTPPPASKANSETPVITPSRKAKPVLQLVEHLPRAEADAMKTFEGLESNRYQYSTLGRSRETLESMTCDCQFVPGEDDPDAACGDGSNCINRLTQVECLEDDCRCRSHCRNQRMQRREYANIEVVLTEKKGFGLRAGSEIDKDAFIYEYIGDVVNQASLTKRMKEYADEGLRHFYFMMLQKDEFIDATKRGGIGRFANHSCNPNCYVAKWTVGKHVRMGIYAKRKIKKDEELTFNYNVDRYGHEAQPCYCGEQNCVGFLGGKTQTDVAAMDDLYLDALGIAEEVEMYGLKGTKKKKGKKLDEDYVPVLKPLFERDVPKVIQALRQAQSQKVLLKLLTRIKMTADHSALRQLMRLRGYSLMCNILVDYSSDIEVCMAVLECICTWPLMQRNKIEDSKIEEPVRELVKSDDEKLKASAEKLLAHWDTLETYYRIPKRAKGDKQRSINIEVTYDFDDKNRVKRSRMVDAPKMEPDKPRSFDWKPERMSREPAAFGWGGDLDASFSRQIVLAPVPRRKKSPPPRPPSPRRSYWGPPSRLNVASVVEAAARAAEEARKNEQARLAAEAKAKEAAAAKAKAKTASKEKSMKSHSSSSKSIEEKEALKEKKLLKLIGAVVVKCMSKYQKQMDHDTFKKHAKELTQIIAEKEKKSNSYLSGKLDALSEEKVNKIKKFSKEYIAKLLRRLEKSGSKRPSDAGHGDGGHTSSTPRSEQASGSRLTEDTLEQSLDLRIRDDSWEQPSRPPDFGMYDDDQDDVSVDPSPFTDANGPEPSVAIAHDDDDIGTLALERKYRSSVAGPVKIKRSRWDQGPPSSSSVTPSLSNPESLYAGL